MFTSLVSVCHFLQHAALFNCLSRRNAVYLGRVGVESPTGAQEAFKHGSDSLENEEILVLQQREKLTVRTRSYSERQEILFMGCVSAP